MNRALLILSFVLLLHKESRAENVDGGLVQNQRSFEKYLDEDKLKSYLSSFGANPTPAETELHEVFKRSSSVRKTRKVKKITTTTNATPDDESIEVITEAKVLRKPLTERRKVKKYLKTTTEAHLEATTETKVPRRPLPAQEDNAYKNINGSARQTVKFELDDAKYSEEYEKLKRSRKLRGKRAAGNEKTEHDDDKITNESVQDGAGENKGNFRQPKEIFRFSFLDAVTKGPIDAQETNENSEKKKREVNPTDSTATDTKHVHLTHPMRGYRSTKQVAYDDIPTKLQKMIDSALKDAMERGKATDGDYLKFYYGDKIIKVPFSMSKYISLKPKAEKETKVIYGKKEENILESPKLLGLKNAYIPYKDVPFKFEKSKPSFFLPTTEKAESYANFETPIVVQPDIQESKPQLPPNKSIYFYSSDDIYYGKNTVSSPGPVVFEDSTTPSSIDFSKPYYYKNLIPNSPPTKGTVIKDATPIVENVDEVPFSYVPFMPHQSHQPIPKPTSYVEYAGNHADTYDYAKSYEFGYHVSDYKTGNNFGHTQKSNKEETKGEYSILLPDGRVQIVKYVANDSGFHADVSYQNVH